MEQELKTLKIVNVPGQDVNVLAEKLADKAGQIEGATENPPSDLAFLVATAFQSSTDELFRHQVNEIFNSLDIDPDTMHFQEVLEKLTSKYNSLVANGAYTAAKDRNADKDNELAAMSATIKRLETSMKSINEGRVDNNTQSKPSTPGLSKIRGEKSPPGHNDPKTYINKRGTEVHWCTKCDHWRVHSTQQHDEWIQDKEFFL